MASGDLLDLALSSDRAIFVAACPFPFLYRPSALRRLRMAMRRTQEAKPVRGTEDITDVNIPLPDAPASGAPLLLAVRKVGKEFPGMITVGRTANNDVVVEDAQVSKFHAFFREGDTGLHLFDAGSRNGTFIDGDRLVPKASWTSSSVTPGRPVRPGTMIRFGDIELFLLDAAAAWDRVRNNA